MACASVPWNSLASSSNDGLLSSPASGHPESAVYHSLNRKLDPVNRISLGQVIESKGRPLNCVQFWQHAPLLGLHHRHRRLRLGRG